MKGWTMTIWSCFCGRRHAIWWKTVPPPSCPLWKNQPKRRADW